MTRNLTRRGRGWRAFVALAVLATTLVATPSQVGAQFGEPDDEVRIEVENLQDSDGFFFTEVWAGLHSGDFDLFDEGAQPTPGLEALAEDGDPTALAGEFDSGSRLQTTVGTTPIAPGATFESAITVINAAAYPYFSFASMMLPSNDAFFGNEDPTAYPIFDAAGNALGPVEILIFAEDVYDAGTEANNVMGLPFVEAPASTATETADGVLPLTDGLEPYVGADTAAGTTIADGLDQQEPIARITISVAPALTCGNQPVTVDLALGEMPTDGDDVIFGTDAADDINGLGGNDVICGEGGDDRIRGGTGKDILFGGSGNDDIGGGRGNDEIFGQDGNDLIAGGRGNDTITGNGGADDISGDNGADVLLGDFGFDILRGNNGTDTLDGGPGNDTLRGGKKADTLDGGSGLDVHNGDAGSDTCAMDPDGLDEVVNRCVLV